MTTYRLCGVVIDSEGKPTVLDEFASNAQRNDRNIKFYLDNGFKGSLIQVKTELNGTKTQETIYLGSCIRANVEGAALESVLFVKTQGDSCDWQDALPVQPQST